MKKAITIFVILFLMITNSCYAMQQAAFSNYYQQDLNFDKDISKVIISEPTITKEKSEKNLEEIIKLSGSSITYDTPVDRVNVRNNINFSVTDVVYKDNSASINAVFTDLSITSLSVKPGTAYPPFNVGETASFQYKIANYGNTVAINTDVMVKVDNTPIGSIDLGSIVV
ncbi:hypothetical protein V6C27_14675 [Peptococcaceae bacterium 1198_IL3148]